MCDSSPFQSTPIELRRLFIADALFDNVMGLRDPSHLDRLLMTLNTSYATAVQYYDIKSKVFLASFNHFYRKRWYNR